MKFGILCLAAIAASGGVAHAADSMAGGAPIMPGTVSYNATLYGGVGHGDWTSVSTGSWNLAVVGAEGHAGKVSGNTGMQADLWGGASRYRTADDWTDSTYFFAAGAHLNKRSADGLVGGLVSIATAPAGYRDTLINVAAEGQKDLGGVTIGGQAGYLKTIVMHDWASGSLSAPGGWYLHGTARWFYDDNVMVAADAGYSSLTGAADQLAKVSRWGLRFEYKPESRPVSAFVAYQGYNWNQGSSGSALVNTVMVGLTFIGNGETLKQRYRGPAGLADLNPIYGVNYAP